MGNGMVSTSVLDFFLQLSYILFKVHLRQRLTRNRGKCTYIRLFDQEIYVVGNTLHEGN